MSSLSFMGLCGLWADDICILGEVCHLVNKMFYLREHLYGGEGMSFQLLFRNYLVYKLCIYLTHKFKTCSVIVLIELWLGEKFSLYSCKPTHMLCVCLILFCRFCLILDSFGIVCRIYIVPITSTYNFFFIFYYYFLFFLQKAVYQLHTLETAMVQEYLKSFPLLSGSWPFSPWLSLSLQLHWFGHFCSYILKLISEMRDVSSKDQKCVSF